MAVTPTLTSSLIRNTRQGMTGVLGVSDTAAAAERSATPTRVAAVACDFMTFTSCFAGHCPYPRRPERRLGLVEAIGHPGRASARACLFDHLVGAKQDRRRYRKSERVG